MLRPFHYSILISIPSLLCPSIREYFFNLSPVFPEKSIVTRQLPLPIHLHDTSHLPISRSRISFCSFRQRQISPKVHQPILFRGIVKLHIAHCLCQTTEQKGSSHFIIPDMSTWPLTRTKTIHYSFPTHQMTARQTKYCLRAQSSQVKQSCLFHCFRIRTIQKWTNKQESLFFQLLHTGNHLLGHFPCISKLSAIIIAYYGRWPSFTVREIPSQIKIKCFRSLRSNCFFYCQRSHRIFIWRLFPFYHNPVFAKIVPKVQNGIIPWISFWRSPITYLSCWRSHQSDCPPCRILFVNSFGV